MVAATVQGRGGGGGKGNGEVKEGEGRGATRGWKARTRLFETNCAGLPHFSSSTSGNSFYPYHKDRIYNKLGLKMNGARGITLVFSSDILLRGAREARALFE